MKKMHLSLDGKRITAWLVDSVEEYVNHNSFDNDCLPLHDPYNAGMAYNVHNSDELYNVYFVDFSSGTSETICTAADFSDQYDEDGNFLPCFPKQNRPHMVHHVGVFLCQGRIGVIKKRPVCCPTYILLYFSDDNQ